MLAEEQFNVTIKNSLLDYNTDKNYDHLECNICYTRLNILDDCVNTKCEHVFCINCFGKWARISSSCAVCRRKIISDSNTLCNKCNFTCGISYNFCPSCGCNLRH
jgi:hypothetical protein